MDRIDQSVFYRLRRTPIDCTASQVHPRQELERAVVEAHLAAAIGHGNAVKLLDVDNTLWLLQSSDAVNPAQIVDDFDRVVPQGGDEKTAALPVKAKVIDSSENPRQHDARARNEWLRHRDTGRRALRAKTCAQRERACLRKHQRDLQALDAD